MKDLITIDESTVLEVFTKPDGLESAIQQIEKTARSIVPDVSTDKGRKSIRSSAARIASGKVKLDNLGKAVAAEAKATVKLIDGNRRVVRDRLDALKVEIRTPLTEFEDLEKKRIHDIGLRMKQIKMNGETVDFDGNQFSIEDLEIRLEQLNRIVIDDSFQEFKTDAEKAHSHSMAAIRHATIQAIELKSQQDELERLRQEAEERKKQEYEAGLKRRAAEDARLDAERKAREESARIEYEKQEAVRQKDEAKRQAEASEKARVMAEEKARSDAIAAEKRRLEDIENAKQAEIARQEHETKMHQAEEESRAADLKHANKIKTQSRNDLMDIFHIDAGFAADIVAAIDDGKISNIMISY